LPLGLDFFKADLTLEQKVKLAELTMGLKIFFNGNPDKLETADGVENSIVIQGTQPINTFFYHAGPRKRQIKMLKSTKCFKMTP